jgi:hypothetical protein
MMSVAILQPAGWLLLNQLPIRLNFAPCQMVNWLDLGANTVPPLVSNAVTERWYFPGVVRRLNRHLRERGLAPQQQGGGAGGVAGGAKS